MPLSVLRVTHYAVEIAIVVLLVLLGGVILREALLLGSGWGEQGPQPGFFPFVLSVAIMLGCALVLLSAMAAPDRRPFFEVRQEVTDLLKVSGPIVAAVAMLPWAGLYITSGLYLAGFMGWYGRFRWWQALIGGIALPVMMWLLLSKGFNIPMPASVFYRTGQLPF